MSLEVTYCGGAGQGKTEARNRQEADMTATFDNATHAVLNCHVTEVLGLFSCEQEAAAAARSWGQCSFAYELSEQELDGLDGELSGFTCKQCGGPSPCGVGYAALGIGAFVASQDRAACPCGYSQAPR